MVSHQCRKQQWLFLALPNTELSGCYSVPWLHCSLGLRGVCECVFLTAWIVRKHLWEWQPAPPPLMSAEWTNPHTTHSAWQQVAVTVPFSSLPSFFFSCFFLRISLSLSLSLPFKALFKIFHLCTLYFSFFIFLYYFFGASQAHRRTGNYHCGRKLAASFPVYTQTHICTLLHIHHRSEPPLVRLPMQTNQKQLHSTEAFIFLYLQAEGALKRLKLTLTVIYLSGRRLRWAAAKLKLKALDYHSRIFIWPCFNQVLIPTHACTCRSCSSVLQQVDSPMERWSVEVSMGRREWLISTILAAGAVLSGGLILKKKRWKQTQIYQQSRPQWVERKTEQDEMKVLQTEIEKTK